MASTSRYIRVHQDALIEWITDDSFFFEDDYSIIKDTINNFSFFTFSENAQISDNFNKIPNQLYLVDQIINKYSIVDPTNKPFLQETQYTNNAPSRFDKVKIWMPIHWNFSNLAGLYLKISALNYENSTHFGLSSFYLDASVPNDLNKLTTESEPLRLFDKLWGKSITLYIPSIYTEALNRINNAPTLGTINYNLTSGQLGLSTTSPIFIDFRYLRAKETILNQTYFYTLPSLVMSIPQAPEYNNLTVEIQEATDGDYFLINGLYNGNIGEFEQFMTMLDNLGKRSYLLYSITVFEELIPQDSTDIYVYQDFYKQISYRPILKYTNTTASIQVEMKLINSVNGSVISKITNFLITGSNIGKYGKYVTPINISNAIKPKIYNSKPDNLVLPSQSIINYQLKKNSISNSEIRYISYPVLTNVANIVADQLNGIAKGETYKALGGLNINMTPFDNIIKFRIAEKNGDTIKPMSFPSNNSSIRLIFKSATSELKINLFMESNEVNLSSGILVFKISSSDYPTIKKINETSENFYITITSNSIETSIYDGTFSLLENVARPIQENQVISNTQINNKNINNKLKPGLTVSGNSKNIINTKSILSQPEKIKTANLSPEQLKMLK